MASLSRWLGDRGLVAGDLDGPRTSVFSGEFLAARGRPLGPRALRPLLDWLRGEGVIGEGPKAVAGPLEDLLDSYRTWMVTERALSGGRSAVTSRPLGVF